MKEYYIGDLLTETSTEGEGVVAFTYVSKTSLCFFKLTVKLCFSACFKSFKSLTSKFGFK